MEVGAASLQSQVQTAVLAKAMQTNEASVLQMLAQLEQTQQAVAQSAAQLSSGRVDVTV